MWSDKLAMVMGACSDMDFFNRCGNYNTYFHLDSEVRAMFRKVFSSDEVADIVMKVVGEIEPVGETYTDDARFDHLILLLNTLDILIDEVRFILPNIDRNEYSMNRAGQLANKWIKDKYELFENDIGGES